jgi:hypothetical protein
VPEAAEEVTAQLTLEDEILRLKQEAKSAKRERLFRNSGTSVTPSLTLSLSTHAHTLPAPLLTIASSLAPFLTSICTLRRCNRRKSPLVHHAQPNTPPCIPTTRQASL